MLKLEKKELSLYKKLLEKLLEGSFSKYSEDQTFINLVKLFVRDSSGNLSRYDSLDVKVLADDFYEKFENIFSLLKTKGKKLNFKHFVNKKRYSNNFIIISDDCKFLVESITEELQRRKLNISFFFNSVVEVNRDKFGKIIDFNSNKKESWIFIESTTRFSKEEINQFKEDIKLIIQEVNNSVKDFEKITQRIRAAIDSLKTNRPKNCPEKEYHETLKFLDWIESGHFTFLGLRRFDIKKSGKKISLVKQKDQELGILRDDSKKILKIAKNKFGHLNSAVEEFINSNEIVLVAKANIKSNVRRQVYMDYISIKIFNEKGIAIAEERVVGLFTYETYRYSILEIPILRQKAKDILDKSGFREYGHNYRSLVNAIETYPRDEFFQSSTDELFKAMMTILQLMKCPFVKFIYRRDRFGRFASIMVYIPRDRFSTAVREEINKLLVSELKGRPSAFYVSLTEHTLSRVHFIVGLDPESPVIEDIDYLEEKVEQLTKRWIDDLEEKIIDDDELPIDTFKNYENSFSLSYQDRLSTDEAKKDIKNIEVLKLSEENYAINIDVSRKNENSLEITLYSKGNFIKLSDFVPIFKNMKLMVTKENNYVITPSHTEETYYISDFFVDFEIGDLHEFDHLGEAILAILNNKCPNDGFNAMVISANMSWKSVSLFRGLSNFALQGGIGFSINYIAETLVNSAEIVKHIYEMFLYKFDVNLKLSKKERENKISNCIAKINTLLENVASADEDLILKSFLEIIQSCLRTNYFQTEDDNPLMVGLAFKFDSHKISFLPKPKPFREIYVTSPLVEGSHLRFGPVSRGGLRWSDRKEDFRTEVLGLVKAQNVKNSLIVARGAKGCFYPLNLSPLMSKNEFAETGQKAYEVFVASLLSLTDNIIGEETKKPKNMLCYDGDDSYLVVAADKGTARFSDLANSISEKYNFWLGDAFASGGSAGYDHKKMGITARGAWVAVQRHFRELGKDIQKEETTVVGVGDMSGDIFGNGMLLSKMIKLKAAFDHRHIFIDPDPDPAISFAERERMFKLPYSSWEDYDKKAISNGGGVYSRDNKTIKLSKNANEFLGLDNNPHTVPEIIKAILAAKTDLLWLGGIGTYVKAVEENDVDVGDKANNKYRVSSEQVGATVIGEGANLGITQRARIELAFLGKKLNTDAVDNSAGVDSSDHEVNIKILLKDVQNNGLLDIAKRNKLLARMTNDVAKHVLYHNYTQTNAISQTVINNNIENDLYNRIMRYLEKEANLERDIEKLPSEKVLDRRTKNKQSLTRPEISVLLAYIKNDLIYKLNNTNLYNDKTMEKYLFDYFPKKLHEYDEFITRHKLKNEIIVTKIVNELVERMGLSFVFRMMNDYDISLPLIFKAYFIANNIVSFDNLIKLVEKNDMNINPKLQAEIYDLISSLITEKIIWLVNLQTNLIPNMFDFNENVENQDIFNFLIPKIDELNKSLKDDNIVKNSDHEYLVKMWNEKDLPKNILGEIKRTLYLKNILDLIFISSATKLPIEKVFIAFYRISKTLSFNKIYKFFESTIIMGQLEKQVKFNLFDEFKNKRAYIIYLILSKNFQNGKNIDKNIFNWTKENEAIICEFENDIGNLKIDKEKNIAKLYLINNVIDKLLNNIKKTNK